MSCRQQLTPVGAWLAQAASRPPSWYAVRTHANHEKVVALQLRERGISEFLPVVKRVHRWSDRRKVIEAPLFPGYAFVNIEATAERLLQVRCARGVVDFVTMGGAPVPIPDEQIESVRKLTLSNLPCVNHPFLKVGQRVRIRGGCLDGVVGILTRARDDRDLVVSIDFIERAIAVRIRQYDVEMVPIEERPPAAQAERLAGVMSRPTPGRAGVEIAN